MNSNINVLYNYTLFTAISNFEVQKSLCQPSLQNLSPLPPRLKVKSTDLAISWT